PTRRKPAKRCRHYPRTPVTPTFQPQQQRELIALFNESGQIYAVQRASLVTMPHPSPKVRRRPALEYELRRAMHDHLKHNSTTTADLFPMTVYLTDESRHEEVERAIAAFIEAFDLEETIAIPPALGSWLKRLLLRSRNVATSDAAKDIREEVRRAVELHGIHKIQAEVDERKAAAASTLIQALDSQQRAAVLLGSMIILKSGNSLVVRELTQRELIHLERNPKLLQNPAELLEALQCLPWEEPPAIEGVR
ncbi:hypothetical protein, partial [Nonomuraea lactucae]|uniref:hypothetical protein n=1 Tax=Nonomuraea lactucae TaxID=2249762 RepID=UPI001964C5DB